MGGRDEQEPGLPLDETIERWTPKEVWRRYREIANADVPFYFPANPDPLSVEAFGLRAQIENILTNKLRRGELIASGLPVPLEVDTRRRDLSPELWSRLKLDILHGEASGDGLRVVELRFRTATQIRSEQTPIAVKDIKPAPTRRAGRPSLMSIIEAEMRRRAANDQIESSLRREAEVLAIWANQEFPHTDVPKPKSIAKRLGRVYRQLKTTKRPDKSDDKL
jgi:hypothetical protein